MTTPRERARARWHLWAQIRRLSCGCRVVLAGETYRSFWCLAHRPREVQRADA